MGRVLAHVVRLITLVYKGKSAIKLSALDHKGKLLMCASTFPITHVVREIILENFTLADLGEKLVLNKFFLGAYSHGDAQLISRHSLLFPHSLAHHFTPLMSGLYIGGEKFSEFGGNMKAWNNDNRKDRWVNMIKSQPYLLQ